METTPAINTLSFLNGGGEMGELTRRFDWSQTSINSPDSWPHSLRTTVSNLLRSRFPTFLWWGDDMIQFYNDAYRPSLGKEGKHPTALGQHGKECWPEIWDSIYPLIEGVKQDGEPTWMENQLIPIYRNDTLENVYWTFSYSLVLNDEAKPGGVLVTCMETTVEMAAIQSLEQKELSHQLAMEIGGLGSFTINLKTGTAAYSQQIIDWFGLAEEGLPLATILTHVHPDDQAFVDDTLTQSIAGKDSGRHDITYRIGATAGTGVRYLRSIGQVQAEAGVSQSLSGIIQDVTEQVLSRKKIESSEARFRSLIEEAPVATAVFVGRNLVIDVANEAMLHIWGKATAPLGQPFAKALPEREGQPFLKILDDVFTTGETYTGIAIEAELVKDGVPGTYYFDLTYKPLFNEAGEVYAIMDMAVDVTEQVLTRQKIEESQRSLLALFQESPVGIATITATDDFTFEFANAFYGALVGRQPEALMGKPLFEALPEIKDQGFDILLKGVVATGQPFEAKELPAKLVRNGRLETVYINFTYHPRIDEAGGITGILAVVIDVTQQVLTRKQIEESEQALRNMIVKAPVAICIFRGPQYVIDIANESMFAFWGKPGSEVLHKPLFEALPEAKGQGYEELLANTMRTGQSFSAREMPIRLPRNAGVETVYNNFSYEPMFDAQGSVSAIMAVAADVTAERMSRKEIENLVVQRTKQLGEANEVMQQTNKELQRSNAYLEEFAHAASHDLKEPIRKIHFFTNRLKEQLSHQLSGAEVQSFGRIENATQRMGSLIDDLLLYSHVSQRPHEKETVDLNDKLKRVLEDLELDVEEKSAVINIQKLPVVQGYSRQLQQLFQNLISNALKYSKADVPPRIDISASKAEETERQYNVIAVKDNGIGFEEQYAEKIFQMFSRLHGKNEYGGTGVGLSIVKKVVENHNGFIRVESIVGEGSVFKIYLPV